MFLTPGQSAAQIFPADIPPGSSRWVHQPFEEPCEPILPTLQFPGRQPAPTDILQSESMPQRKYQIQPAAGRAAGRKHCLLSYKPKSILFGSICVIAHHIHSPLTTCQNQIIKYVYLPIFYLRQSQLYQQPLAARLSEGRPPSTAWTLISCYPTTSSIQYTGSTRYHQEKEFS